MMKKGFTLAEVLITLTIIGVVAVLTLPGLMLNTAEQQARTALKKMVNTFTQAAEMNAAISGYDYSGVVAASTSVTIENVDNNATIAENTMLKMFIERLGVARDKGVELPSSPAIDNGYKTITKAVYLKDGTAIYFGGADVATKDNGPGVIQSDGVMRGFNVLFDTNGAKAPNLVSTCTGTAGNSWSSDNSASCQAKSNRYIKDIFMMRLRNDFVAPIGAASGWILDDKQDKVDTLNQG